MLKGPVRIGAENMVSRQSLCGIWNISKVNTEKQDVLDVFKGNVPGTVLKTLLEMGRIENPYWRTNEYVVREEMQNDYIYEREFTVSSLEADKIELVCEGLDTIADIYLNEKHIASVDDMHRQYRFSVKNVLHCGINTIRIYFKSALKAVRAEDAENDIHYASTGCIHGNAFLRKAHYMFGWDWGPQLPDAGIFRDIRLEYLVCARIKAVKVFQHHASDGSVVLEIETELEKVIETQQSLQMSICLSHPDGYEQKIRVPYQKQYIIQVLNPQLWWPNGIGEHPLYKLQVQLFMEDGGGVADQKNMRLGLRTIGVCRDKHDYGEEFAFIVNGVKIFAMGANYIPEDNLLTRVSEARTRRILKDCAAANFNCIRVWGGGYYPDDFFYDACDEEGILVWQDLMFACNVYALNDHFEENIVEETRDNVKRLRHHACIALWCGNNEMEWGWGDMWERIKGHHPRYKADYTKIFEYILPKVVKECDEITFWWPSSPSSGGSYDDPNAVERGDQHYWEVWHSGKPFTEYRKNYFSFCSEYGFQSFPGMKTIESFTLPEDRNIFSEVMESHQKNGTANGKILNYIADYFLYPSSLKSLVYISQILQLKAIQYGVEHWRQNRGRCMGSLYWQLNDCWPVASWSSIDYYGRWKALHYGARRFYAPIMVSACEKEELSTEIDYYINNDTLKEFDGCINIALINSDFKVLWDKEMQVNVPAMQSQRCIRVDFQSILLKIKKERKTDEIGNDKIICGLNNIFARIRLFNKQNQIISERTTLFVKPKHFNYGNPEYKFVIHETKNYFVIDVKSSAFAQYVELDFKGFDAIFSDNYFDLTDKEGKTVTVEKKENLQNISVQEIEKHLTIHSVFDTYYFDENAG